MTKKEIQQLIQIVKLFEATEVDLTEGDVNELFDYIRIGIKDLLLNLEATQREVTELKKKIKELQ